MSIKNRPADILMTLSAIDILRRVRRWENRKMTIEEDNFLVGKQNNVGDEKVFVLSFCVAGRNDGKQEKETMLNRRHRNKGKGTHEERKTSRMISIHREMIS